MRSQDLSLLELLRPGISALGYELLGLERLSSGATTLLRIYIDSDKGISIDDCVRASDQITGVLDVEDPIPGPYTLEVSSPGFDRPLFSLAQFERFVGKQVTVRLREKTDGRRRLRGRISAVTATGVVLEADGRQCRIEMQQIDKARLVAGD